MANNLNEELEKLNAQIDVYIDDEDYDEIWSDTKGIITLRDNVESEVRRCFPDNNHSTHGNTRDSWWRDLLNTSDAEISITTIKIKDKKEVALSKDIPIEPVWSHLFYAKLLRAKIKQKGSDCYTRRLDDVAAYLERHLPQQSGQDEWGTRLRLMYLLELSAVSLDWESLGFSERAQRVITDAKHSPRVKKAVEKAPYEFYDLWAHYNIGVAYFHRGYYRKAVLEFNKVIWQVENWKKRTEPRIFLDKNHGIELLYLPAILYRAEVQLKLQFAYHSLDTLDTRFWNNKDEKISVKKWRTRQKEIRANIIGAQAYQQMGRLDKSWGILEGILPLLGYKGKLGHRIKANCPKFNSKNHRFPNLQERFIDILIADHLGWLVLEGEDKQQPELNIRHLVKENESIKREYIASNYIKTVREFVDEDKSYPKKLENAFSTYFEVVKHHAYNRRGYFQQLAKYLAWLAKVADFKYSDPNFARGQEKDVNNERKKIAEIANELCNRAKEDGLLFEEDELDKPKEGCRYCDAKGIDLRRIEPEHYTWFTDSMLEFFNSKKIMEVGLQQEGNIDEGKRKFVKRLIKLEWKEGEDLRIHDLKLRYEYYKPKELLKHSTEWWKVRKGMELCWRGHYLKNEEGFAGLLECARGNKRNQENCASTDHLTSDDYRNIMQDWDRDFLRHLKSPSIHENHQKGGFYFMGLQRWNSASPAKGFSVGGGYLLYHYDKDKKRVDMGVAIDPGFDFVRNLFHMGFSLDDIDIVLISHAHLDHIRDFESIVMLLSELKKRSKREKRVHVILSLGAYKRLEHIVEDPGFRYSVEPYIIDVDREIIDDYFEIGIPQFSFESVKTNSKNGNSNGMERFKAVLPPEKDPDPDSNLWVKIKPARAYHDDKTRSDSFGFLIELSENNPDKLIFGYTGDTKWVYPNMPDPLEKDRSKGKREGRQIEDIAEQYKECDVLLVHLGSLIGKDDNGKLSFAQYDQCSRNENEYRCEELVRENGHPYLIGMLRLLSSYYKNLPEVEPTNKPLVLVGEFGEELRGTIRTDFIQRLREVYRRKIAFLPVDVGLNVLMGKKDGAQGDSNDNRCACKVWCVQCDHFVNIDDADFELYGTDHALYCVCKTCRKATPINVLQDKLRQLYEVGIELRNNDNK